MKVVNYPYVRKARKYSRLLIGAAKLKTFSELNPRSMYSAGRVVVYPQIGLVYNRVRKAANSSTLAFIAESLLLNGYDSFSESDHELTKSASRSYGKSIYELSVEDVRRMSGFCFFTVVRNPYSRLLSAFLHKRNEALKGALSYQKVPGMLEGGASGFNDFVSFIESGGLFKDSHWWPQKDLLFLPVEKFDYIVKVESLASGIEQVVSSVGLKCISKDSLSKPHCSETSLDGKVTNSSKLVGEYYSSTLINRVYSIYKDDFESFGYDPEDFIHGV